MALDGVFAHVLTKELNARLKDMKVEKVFQPQKDEIVLIMRAFKKSERLLLCCGADSARAHITKGLKQNPLTAPLFCMILRKHLSGARLLGINQNGVERALEFEFQAYNDLGDKCVKYLIIEIMGRFSNIILVDQKRVIINAVKHVDITTSSQRQVLPGLFYQPPPVQNKLNPLELGLEQLERLLFEKGHKKCDKLLLDSILGLSPIVCRELCHKSGVLDMYAKDLDDELKRRFCAVVLSHFKSVNDGRAAPHVLNDKVTKKPLYFSYIKIEQYSGQVEKQKCDSFSELLDLFYLKRDQAHRIEQRKAHLLKVLNKQIERQGKKLDIQTKELSNAKNREYLKVSGDLIIANIYRIQKGDAFVFAKDYSNEIENSSDLKIALDVGLTPSQNAQRYYKEYRRKKTAEAHLKKWVEKTKGELDYLESVLDSLRRAGSVEDFAEIKEELAEQGYIGAKKEPKTKNKNAVKAKNARLNFLRFKSFNNRIIYCGKNNVQNDYITFTLAKKNDVWLHAKSIHGAHVVISCDEGPPDQRTLIEAAQIAAVNSKARDQKKVEVDYTQVKNVRRAALKKPGMVYYTMQKTIVVSPDTGLCIEEF